MSCTHTSTLGVYLLGALEPEERSAFETHLSGCDACRTELVRLAPLPGLLNQITLDDFDEHGEPATPELPVLLATPPVPVAELPPPAVMVEPRAPEPAPPPPRPARNYGLLAAAAALVVAIAASGILVYQSLRTSTPASNTAAPPTASSTAPRPVPAGTVWSATSPQTGVHAEARLIERPWGTEIMMTMANVPTGDSCRLVVWAKGANGYRETAGWWSDPGHESNGEIPASTSIDYSMISRLEVMSDDNTLLLDIPRP
jgi:hypothetical protein